MSLKWVAKERTYQGPFTQAADSAAENCVSEEIGFFISEVLIVLILLS